MSLDNYHDVVSYLDQMDLPYAVVVMSSKDEASAIMQMCSGGIRSEEDVEVLVDYLEELKCEIIHAAIEDGIIGFEDENG